MSTLKNLIKLAAVGAVVYGAYKYGKSVGDKSFKPKETPHPFPELRGYPFEEVEQNDSEEKYLIELIQELKNKPNKTQKDRYNIELLEIKLKQIRDKK